MIKVVDDFFTQKELESLRNNLDEVEFLPVGNYGYSHRFRENEDNKWIFDKIKNRFFPNEDLKPVDSSFRHRHNHKKVLDHKDKHKYNFIGYLKGEELVHNGTGFFNYKKELDHYVGFIENRALFFPGDKIYHTDLQAIGKSSPRYTINIFYD
tara:strand:+ start:81 stop:539 length:459 start_codon:yes stop_codon:yes gene_type:complete